MNIEAICESLVSTSMVMVKVASRTVRVTGIPRDVGEKAFREVAERLCSKTIKTGVFSTAIPGYNNPVSSFASQFEGNVGTITLPSEKHKDEALGCRGIPWKLDDKFDGLTILCSPHEPDLE